MQHLVFLAPGQFEWQEAPTPRVQNDTDAIVRPIAVARCDLDLYIAIGGVNYKGPFAFGHESVGEVIDAGPRAGVVPGQRVVVPFQLSCGACAPCRRGHTNSCAAFPFGAAYGLKPTSGTEFGGALAGAMHVPHAHHMLLPLPDGVDPVAAASACDNISDGWRAVGPHLAERPGATVLVTGGLVRSVAIYAAGCAVAEGAGRVLYLDDDADRRARAAALGAEARPLTENLELTEEFDIVVDGAGTPELFEFAVRRTAPNGVMTSVAIYFGRGANFPLLRAYYKGITFNTSRVQSRAVLPHVLNCLSCGRLHAERVTSLVCDFAEAPRAMADMGPKVVFTNNQLGA